MGRIVQARAQGYTTTIRPTTTFRPSYNRLLPNAIRCRWTPWPLLNRFSGREHAKIGSRCERHTECLEGEFRLKLQSIPSRHVRRGEISLLSNTMNWQLNRHPAKSGPDRPPEVRQAHQEALPGGGVSEGPAEPFRRGVLSRLCSLARSSAAWARTCAIA